MVEAETAILEELDRLAPPESGEGADWGAAVRRASPPRHGRRTLAVAAVLAATALLVPALTLSATLRSLVGLRRPPGPVLARSHLVVSGPIGNGLFAHLWAAPSSRGGSCSFVVIDRSAATPAHAASSGSRIVCLGPIRGIHGQAALRVLLLADGPWVVATAQSPFTVDLAIEPLRPGESRASWTPPYLVGAVYPGLHATRVRLEWRGGSEPLTLRGGHFVGGGPVLYKPPYANLPYWVVAYDAAGRVVARHKLDDPSLELSPEGWKSFSPGFRAWRAHHRRAR